MISRLWAAGLLLLLSAINTAVAAEISPHAALRQAPLPDWFEPANPDLATQSRDKTFAVTSTGLEFILFDRQIDVASEASTAHVVYRITSESGLADGAQLTSEFDPSYETLTFHFIRTWRNGVARDRLNLNDVKVLQQERELDRQIFNGRLSTLQLLPDVRVGDIVEYATTRRGANPVFGGKFITTEMAGWSSPLRHQRLRVLVPPGRSLQLRAHGEPAFTHTRRELDGGATELTWDGRALAGLTGESEAPDWYRQYPYLELSEFRDWRDVVAWALPLYQPTAPLSEDLREAAAALLHGKTRADDKVLALLDFVQREVRYLGIALGPNSHQPHHPDEVFERRFGDCKDKTTLFCALLNEAGIKAHPVLVNTYERHRTGERLPSPYAFNHVIAHVHLGGQDYWLDPTRNYQRGSLVARDNSSATLGLVIRASTDTLTSKLARPETRARKHLTEVFRSNGEDSPSQLQLTYRYSGEMADSIRYYLANRTRDEITRDYLNLHKRSYPALTLDEPLTWHDDESANIIRIELTCSLPDLWTTEDDVVSASFYPWLLRDHVVQPDSLTRRAPLSLPHPYEVTVETTVHLGEEWSITEDAPTVESPWYRYAGSTRFRNNTLHISHTWTSLADHVEAADLPAHVAKLAEIRRHVGYSLSRNLALARQFNTEALNWRMIALGLLIAGGWIVFARWLWRRPPPAADLPPPISPTSTSRLNGLGGWLILPMIGLCVRPFFLLAAIFEGADSFFLERVWLIYTLPGSNHYEPAVAGLLVFEFTTNFLLLGLTLVAAVFFFARRREAPMLMIVLLASLPLMLVLHYLFLINFPVLMDLDPDDSMKEAIRGIVPALIWIPYFSVSRRVKETFTR